MFKADHECFLDNSFIVRHTTRPSNPPVEIPYITVGNLKAPKEIERLIWEKKNAYQYFYLLYLLSLNANSVCELGIRSGRSTRAILFALRESAAGKLISIDEPQLSPFFEPRPQKRAMGMVLRDIRNFFRPWIQDGASWVGDSETTTSVRRLKRLGLDRWFTHLEADVFSIRDAWFLENKFDVVVIDFDPCDLVNILMKFVRDASQSQIFVVHNALRTGEKTAIEWLRKQPSYQRSISFEEGLGLALVQMGTSE